MDNAFSQGITSCHNWLSAITTEIFFSGQRQQKLSVKYLNIRRLTTLKHRTKIFLILRKFNFWEKDIGVELLCLYANIIIVIDPVYSLP